MTHPEAARCRDLARSYRTGGSTVAAVRGVTLTLPAGTVTALVGPSGSGKSTLLRLFACLDRPDAGSITIGGRETATMSRRGRVRVRRHQLGLLHQQPSANLLDYLTVAEHLSLGAALRGRADRAAGDVADLLHRLGLAERADHLPRQLSGGEQQRTAIAFAAIGPPTLLVADEPTGQLDHAAAGTVLTALRSLADGGMAVLAATHDPAVAERADRVVRMRDGRLVGDPA